MPNTQPTNLNWSVDHLIHSIIPFNCAIRIDNKSLSHYDTVSLEQGFNEIPQFTIEISYEHTNDVKLQGAEDVNDFIGKSITIQFYQGLKLEDKSNDFAGIITSVDIVQKHLHRAILTIRGQAKCCLLQQSGKQNRIYQQKDLAYIVNDIAKSYDGKLTIIPNPKVSHTHALVSQYEQSDFDFLNWLSFLCGEPLYWDRDCLRVGLATKKEKPITLNLNNNLVEQRFIHSLQATDHRTLHSYFPTEHRVHHLKDWPKLTGDNYGSYAAHHITAANNWLSRADNKQIVPIHALFQDDITHYQKTLQAIAAKNAHILQGKSTECLLSPSIPITLNSSVMNAEGETSTKDMGYYIVQYVKHTYDRNTKIYSNEFTAIPDTPEAFLHYAAPIQIPKACSQLGEVISNPDQYGRVQVRMQWCGDDKYSPYLYAVQPELGTGTKGKKRGFYFLPRKGDTVVVDALHGNPNFLYISGAISHGKNMDVENNANNNVRWISTDSGHTLVFNDNKEDWGITILDNAGNSLHINTKDKKIQITAPEEIVLHSKKITFDAEQDIQVKAGNNIITTAKVNIDTHAGKHLTQSAANNVHIDAGKIVDVHGKQQIIAYADGRTDIGAKEKLHVHGAITRLTGEDKIEYKCPTMDKVTQKGDFKYTKKKEVVEVYWMDGDKRESIDKLPTGLKATIYVQTRNFEVGETVKLTIREKKNAELQKGKQEIQLSGTIDDKGIAHMQETFYFEPLEKES